MIKLISTMRGFAQGKSGATAIEYGLIAGLVCIVIIAALGLLGEQLGTTFQQITDALSGG